MKILLIEDDEEISDFIKNNLSADIFDVETAFDGANGSFLARMNFYDVIVLDSSLPKKDGVTVCEEIRQAHIMTPIIFLTVSAEIRKKIKALDAGADDYMTKPFAIEELKARIFALSRRPRKIEDSLLIVDDLVLDTLRKTVRRGSTTVYLSRKAYNLLEYLMRNRGVILSRGLIMEYVWNSESDPMSNTVEAHISNLRKKINFEGKRDILKNIPGRGYIIEA